MRSIIVALAALAFATSASAAAPHCTTGKPCGQTCIKKTDVCHIPNPRAHVCNPAVSKPCGNSCIAKDKVCHV